MTSTAPNQEDFELIFRPGSDNISRKFHKIMEMPLFCQETLTYSPNDWLTDLINRCLD